MLSCISLIFLDVVRDWARFATRAAFVQVISFIVDTFVTAKVYTAKEQDTIVAGVSEVEWRSRARTSFTNV